MYKLKEYNFILEENKIKNDNIDIIYKDIKNIIIKNDNIDNIYKDIINILIKNDILSNYECSEKIMAQMDIENINITKTIYDEIYKNLNINNNYYITKYKILELKDLLNEKNINFYYILFKYILKNTFYIYQIPFLLESRKNILKTIKTNLDNISNTFIKDNYNKFKYIIDFFTDLKYYEKYVDSIISNTEQNEPIKSLKNNNLSISSQTSKGNISTKIKTDKNKKQNLNNLNILPDSEDMYKILKYEKVINNFPQSKYNFLRFIKELSNGYFIIGAPGDVFYIYDQNFIYKKQIKIKVPKEEEFKKIFSTQIDTNNIIANNNIKVQDKFFIINVLETNDSKKSKRNFFEINICSKFVFTQNSFYFQNNNDNNTFNYRKIIIIPSNGYFEVDNNNYILYGEKGLFHFNKEPFNLNKLEIQDMHQFQKDERNFKGGIQLDNNLIALTSNKILPLNGEDIIIFYDIMNKKIINQCSNYSFVNNINGLALIDLEKNKKILLCACKKYKNDQKNGILLINADIKENEEINEKFFDTEEFEVNCFCPIKKIKSGNNNYKNNFFLVGGLDTGKRRGVIKIYKIILNGLEMNIELLQEIFFEDSYNEGFEGTINCIVQSKQNGKIWVSCWDKKVYLYSEPNIELYLNE